MKTRIRCYLATTFSLTLLVFIPSLLLLVLLLMYYTSISTTTSLVVLP